MMDELQHLAQEHFVCLFLNTKNQVIGKDTIFIGSLNASIVHPREVFRRAIQRASAAVICLHNHPSGDPSPSAEDRNVTKRLQEAESCWELTCWITLLSASSPFQHERKRTDVTYEQMKGVNVRCLEDLAGT